MKINQKIRNQFRLQNSIFVVLVLSLALILGYLSSLSQTRWDVTNNQRHSLSATSKQFIKDIDGPVNITAYVSKSDVEGSLRPVIYSFLEPFKREKADISVDFIDPREEPLKAEEAGIRFDGELVVQYRGRRENLSSLTEQDLTNLLIRLSRSTDKVIYTLVGHGERSLEENKPRDMSLFGNHLKKIGFRISQVDLSSSLRVNEDASLLIIASPKVNLLPAEANRVVRYLENGGNLLWILEPGALPGMTSVADYIGLKFSEGMVLDPRAGTLNLSPTFSLASRYLDHPATEGASITSVFPLARPIEHNENSDFEYTPLVEIADQGWLEVGEINEGVFNPNEDLPGPHVVAGAFERTLTDKNQRVVIVGSGHALSNQHLGLLGNLDFGVNGVNWLTGDDSLISIQPKSRSDRSLEINLAVFVLANLFLCLPVIFIIAGGFVWWRRRRA